MSFQGINFANQRLLPSDDGRLYQNIFNDGALYGCGITYSGTTLTIAQGHLVIGGRQIEIESAEVLDVNQAVSGFAQIVIAIDLTKTATISTFNQISVEVRYAAAEDGFSTLTQTDINGSGSYYEAQLALLSLGTGGITGIVQNMPQAAFKGAAEGGGLNLHVVGGTAAPSSPKENTLWVNTDTEINGYAFASTEPESPVEGMVWFSTGTDSPAAMNVAKKNTVMLYPTDCKQYIAGAWVKKDAATYQNGAWVDWLTYLYNEGDLCSALTGGWKGVNHYDDYTNGTFAKKASSIQLTAPSARSVITAQTIKKISLAGFNTLKINLTAYSGGTGHGAWVGIFSSDGTNPVAKLDITNKGTKSLDISKFSTGSYYVGVECAAESNASDPCTLTFDKLWLE